MPEIGLANDVTIEYNKDEDDDSVYQFQQTISEVEEISSKGVKFTLKTRREPSNQNEFLYTFETKDKQIAFQLLESTFHSHMDNGRIIKVDD